MSDRRRLLYAGIIVVVGLVWIGQGMGLLGGGFMVNNPMWAWLGGALVVLGVLYGVWPRLRRG